jgi:C1A family cysteine protease
MQQDRLEPSQLNVILTAENAGWQAGETSLSGLSSDEQRLRLGYEPGEGEESLEQRMQISSANLAVICATAYGAPAAVDLRNFNGKNYITSVKDQGGCGSCVAFGTAATVEGALQRQRDDPDLMVDFSEAHLFYCIAKSQGRNCGNGWWLGPALDAFKNPGVVDEGCFPYTAGDQACKLCSDWQSRVIKITGWHVLTSAAQMKEWIATRGPLDTAFTVYSDFFAYKSGVYKHVTGGVSGGHCVCCVGYDDAQGCWICKNSWGKGWGDQGFFRIAYGQCGIDSSMWAVDGVNWTQWYNNKKVLGLWTIDQDRNAWAYIESAGWRKISSENDNIFFNMLVQLAAAKAAARPVNIRESNNVILEVYVL